MIQRAVIFGHQANGIPDSTLFPDLIEHPDCSAQCCGIFFLLAVICRSCNGIELCPVLSQVKDFRYFLGDVRHLLCQLIQGGECRSHPPLHTNGVKVHTDPKAGIAIWETAADFFGTEVINPLHQFFSLTGNGMTILFTSLVVGFCGFLFLFSHRSLSTSLFWIYIYYIIQCEGAQ